MHNRYSLVLAVPFLLAVVFFYFSGKDAENGNNRPGHTINAVIGDKSYVEYYGEQPDENVPEPKRIRTHLKYVVQLLRERPTDHLSTEQRKNRLHFLDLLRVYYRAGEFPRNDGHPDPRRPTFIDRDGNICAVGYLVVQSAGRAVAERINAQYKYAFIPEIDDPLFTRWVKESGFTETELAMIQPQYGGNIIGDEQDTDVVKTNNNRVGLGYGIGSSLLVTAEAFYWANPASEPWLLNSSNLSHWMGMASGAASVILGSINLNNTKTNTIPICGTVPPCWETTHKETNHLRTGVSIANIGVGAATLIRSVYHLFHKPEPRSRGLKIGVTRLHAGYSRNSDPAPALQFRVHF